MKKKKKKKEKLNMSENNNSCTSSTTTSPLLEFVGGGDGGERRDGWWRKVVDVEEVKKQVLFGLPMILTNVCYYGITLVSVMYAGHLGELDLAGATLANSWATVTGFAFMVTFFLFFFFFFKFF